MNVRTAPVHRKVRGHRIMLGAALPVALVAASIGVVPVALADSGAAAAGHGRSAAAHLDRERTWTATALEAAAALAPKDSTPAAASRAADRAGNPRNAPAITGPALMLSALTGSGSSIGKLDFTTAATSLIPTSGPACVTAPVVSPDGTTIATVTFSGSDCQSGTTTIATFDAAGAPLQTLVTVAAANARFRSLSWSPDSATILYTEVTTTGTQLYTVPSAGGSPTALGVGGYVDGAYSHDGTKIVAGDVNDNELTMLNTAGVVLSHFTALTYPSAPAWSPDDSRISFSYDKLPGTADNYGIGVVNADGTGLKPLPVTTNDSSTDVFSSTWSDDGTQIFYDAFGIDPVSGAFTFAPAIFATDVAGQYRATIKSATKTNIYVNPFFVLSGPPATPTASTYTPIDPVRVLPVSAVGPGGTVDVKVAGIAGIPSQISAVTLNLTGVSPTAATFLTAYPRPANNSYPVVSNLNLAAKQIAAIAVQVTVSADGYVRIRNNAGTTGVIVDVSGYFSEGTTADGYVPLPSPVRALDTTIGPAGTKVVPVTALPGAPTNAKAVVLNLTADRPSANTWQSVVPSPLAARPSVSSLNLPKGSTRANLVTAKIGADGTITVYNAFGTVRTIVDVIGYYTSNASAMAYYPINPLRILDTRNGTRTLLGSTAKMGKGGRLDMPTYGTLATSAGITTVPANAQAVAFNLTGVSPNTNTFLATVASPQTPTTSSVNLQAGTIVPNLVISAVGGTTGAVRITNRDGTIAVVGDLAGYYAPA